MPSAGHCVSLVLVAQDFHGTGPFQSGFYSGGAQRSLGKSHFAKRAAQAAPASWPKMNKGTSLGAIPANVLVRLRATVIAGLAKLVDEVNQ